MKREELDKLVEQKVEEKTREIRKENRRLKEEIAGLKEERLQQDSKSTSSNKMDRRGFMKSLGVGAAGLGALALTPGASALDIRSDDLSFYNQASGGLQLEVDSSGNLDLHGNNIQSTGGSENIVNVVGDAAILPANEDGNTTAPDSELANNEVTFEHDTYLGDFIIRFRDDNGTVQTVTLSVD
jgi:hypothetical protein